LTADQNGSYSTGVGFAANNIQVAAGDVILGYLWMGNGGTANAPINFWSPMPQNFRLTPGTVTYNYASSSTAFILFLESTFDLATLSAQDRAGLTDDVVVRMVILPGSIVGGKNKVPVDFNNYNEVIRYFGIDDSRVKRLPVKK
jgi:hypothetical protein